MENFKHYNCIVVFNKNRDRILFCKRMKPPYEGLYNFVGGKVEPGENSIHAAYRELHEETGISRNQITLFPLMDITYYQRKFVLELYVGQLQDEVELIEEKNPLTMDATYGGFCRLWEICRRQEHCPHCDDSFAIF